MGALRRISAPTSLAGAEKTRAAAVPEDNVDAEAACALLASGKYGYIDVRMWEDINAGHVAPSGNVPYYLSVAPRGRPEQNPHFINQVTALHGNEDCLLARCRQSVLSRLTAAELIDTGSKNVNNLEGGCLANPQSIAYHLEPTTGKELLHPDQNE